MRRLARISVEHPRRTLGVWLAVIGILIGLGVGVEDRLHSATVGIPGTESYEAEQIVNERFGDRNTLVVLLRGPEARMERQGRQLARSLERDPKLSVLAPWLPGGGKALRPSPDAALLLVRADDSFETVATEVVPRVRERVERHIQSPVQASVTGVADISAGLHSANVKAAHRAELIAAPLLLIILLLVFRSPVAALIPLVIGLTTIRAGGGVLDLVNRMTDIDAFAFNMASLMGLALGVDYSLVLISRFREELAAGREHAAAVATAVHTAGHTVFYASATVGVAMVGAYFVAPGNLLSSATVGVLTAVILSFVGAVTALPALIMVLGGLVNRWTFTFKRRRRGGLAGVALRAIKRPILASALVLGLMVALGAPALALQSGAPDPRSLPSGAQEREDFFDVWRTIGSGWVVPFEITITKKGSITDPKTLRALSSWQDRIAQREDVQAVLGPGELARRAKRLDGTPEALRRADGELRRGVRDQRRLNRGLATAREGTEELRAGLSEAGNAADLIAKGGNEGAEGARQLAAGLQRAARGAVTLRTGIRAARAGTKRLAGGASQATDGARRLAEGAGDAHDQLVRGFPRIEQLARGLEDGGTQLDKLREPAQRAETELTKALEALDAMLPTSKADPAYRRAYEAVATAKAAVTGKNPVTGARVAEGYDGIDAGVAQAAGEARRASTAVTELLAGLRELDTGLGKLEAGALQLRDGGRQLRGGADGLDRGLGQLADGTTALIEGLQMLDGGSAQLAGGAGELGAALRKLADGLDDGAVRTRPLTDGIERLRKGVAGATVRTKRLGKQLDGADVLADTLDSGYFLLAAVDQAPPAARRASGFALNVDNGGTAAQIAVVAALGERGDVRAMKKLRAHLTRSLDDLEKQTGTKAYLGGPATQVQDFNDETAGRFWLLALVLSLATFLALVAMLRSLLLPLAAVLLNLLTIAAAFGVLTLLFQGDACGPDCSTAIIDGPGYLDAISVFMIFAVAFGLSIDYEIIMLARMREGYLRTGTTDGAIAYGLERTAHVITGAALIMTAVFVASALSDVITLRQVGIAMTVAVLLDSTLIRLVLLPAIMRLLGDANWWQPGWLERLLPHERPLEEEHV